VPEIGMLGYFWLKYDDELVHVPPVSSAILIALHCERGAVHQDALIDTVWERQARISPATFRTHISRLRKTIKNAGFEPNTLFTAIPLTGDRNAYQIGDQVRSDADHVLALGTAGAEALVRGDIELAVRLLRQAAEGWKVVARREQLLAGVADRTFAVPVINQLWEARKNALAKLATAELSIGLDSKPAADLARLAKEWPEDREIARLLAIALHGSGQTLAAADICIRQAASGRALGINVQPFLDLHQAILKGRVPLRGLIFA
jgi:Bacterial transcriptional activator domain/Transcriptional regulatory protein, C terminal